MKSSARVNALGLSRAAGSELRGLLDRALLGERIVPRLAAIRAASSRADWLRCLSRYAQNHTGPTRMQPRERQSDGRWA
jgi:hypothetical protein